MASLTDILNKLDAADESQNGTQSADNLKAPDSHAGSDVSQIGEGGQSVGEPGNLDGAPHKDSVNSVDPNGAHNAPKSDNDVGAGHKDEAPCLDPNQAGNHKSLDTSDEDVLKSLSEAISKLNVTSDKLLNLLSVSEKSVKGKKGKKDNKDLDDNDDDIDDSMGKKGKKGKDCTDGCTDKSQKGTENKSVDDTNGEAIDKTSAEEPALPSEDVTSVSDDEKLGTTEDNKSVNSGEVEVAKAVASDTTTKEVDKTDTDDKSQVADNKDTSDKDQVGTVDTDTTQKGYVLDDGSFTNNVPTEVLLSDMKKSISDISKDYTEGPNSPRAHAILHLYHKVNDAIDNQKSISSSLIESYNSIK